MMMLAGLGLAIIGLTIAAAAFAEWQMARDAKRRRSRKGKPFIY